MTDELKKPVSNQTSKCTSCAGEDMIEEELEVEVRFYCMNCLADVSADDKFCPVCGTELRMPEIPEEINEDSEPVGVDKPEGSERILPEMNMEIELVECSQCGGKIRKTDRYCKYCGQRRTAMDQKRYCWYCGSRLDLDSKYCSECGNAVDE